MTDMLAALGTILAEGERNSASLLTLRVVLPSITIAKLLTNKRASPEYHFSTGVIQCKYLADLDVVMGISRAR